MRTTITSIRFSRWVVVVVVLQALVELLAAVSVADANNERWC